MVIKPLRHDKISLMIFLSLMFLDDIRGMTGILVKIDNFFIILH